MKFREAFIGRTGQLFVPERTTITPDDIHQLTQDQALPIELAGTEVAIPPRVAKTIIAFALQLPERNANNQDCHVFGAEYLSGQSLARRKFGPFDSQIVVTEFTPANMPVQIETLAADRVLYTFTHDEFDATPCDPHVLVPAAEGLYASKLGPSGDIVLGTLDEHAALYPFDTAGIANLEVVA